MARPFKLFCRTILEVHKTGLKEKKKRVMVLCKMELECLTVYCHLGRLATPAVLTTASHLYT